MDMTKKLGVAPRVGLWIVSELRLLLQTLKVMACDNHQTAFSG